MRLLKLSVVLTWGTVSPVECWEHYRHDDLVVLLYEGHDILIVPEVESSLGNLNNPSQNNLSSAQLRPSYLEMGTGHTLGNLFEQRFLDFDKLSRLNHVQNLLYFTKKHHFFLWTSFWPELEKALDDLLGESGVLLQELNHAVRQLSMIKGQTSHLHRQSRLHWDQDRRQPTLTLWSGMRTLTRNCLCSAFKGKANPLIIDPRISRSSPTPLKCSVS